MVFLNTTDISNIKLPILKKEEYDIWAMEMEHYLEYIDNNVWKNIQALIIEFGKPSELGQHLSDDEASNHEDASDTGAAPKQQQQVIPQTTAISNIKLPILKKEEYDIWAMEMEHYLEYIDNDVWKVIQNGNSKKRISTGKDGVIRILPPVTAAEIQAVEKERKAKNILLMAIPKEHMRRFHGMDDAKEIWEAIRTRFGGNANLKKMQKAVFKQQFEALTISSLEGLEKGYDRFQQLLSQLEAHGAEVSTEDANHKFLRSLPPAWSNLAMTMRTKPDVDTLSIEDFKSITNKVMSGFTDAYSTCTPSTSSTNIPEKEALAGFADEIAMIAIRMKKFYKKTGRRVHVDGKILVGFDKKKLKCFNCHNTGHFARECTVKGTHDGKKKRDSFYQHQEAGKQEKNQMGLLTMDDGIVNWGEHTEDEETNHALMAINSSAKSSPQLNDEGPSSSIEQDIWKKWTLWHGVDMLSISYNHLIKDCDFHEKSMAKSVLKDMGKVTVLTRFGRVPVSAAKQSSFRAATSTGAVKQVNTATHTNRVNVSKTRTNTFHKSHSPIRRPFHKSTAPNTSISNEIVNTVRVKGVNTAGQTAVSAIKGNGVTAVKASAGCVWRPKMTDLNNVSKDNSGSWVSKRGNPQQALKNKGIFDSGCSRHMTGNKDVTPPNLGSSGMLNIRERYFIDQ
ncbi:ribonuclease H-like domain-containing protein [Tanacetum coccineum]